MHILHSGTKHSFRARLDSETKKSITLIDVSQKKLLLPAKYKLTGLPLPLKEKS